MTIRYTTNIDLSPNYFIRYNSKDWFIKSIQEIGRKEGLILIVEEQTSSLPTDVFSLNSISGLVLHYKFARALAAKQTEYNGLTKVTRTTTEHKH